MAFFSFFATNGNERNDGYGIDGAEPMAWADSGSKSVDRWVQSVVDREETGRIVIYGRPWSERHFGAASFFQR